MSVFFEPAGIESLSDMPTISMNMRMNAAISCVSSPLYPSVPSITEFNFLYASDIWRYLLFEF